MSSENKIMRVQEGHAHAVPHFRGLAGGDFPVIARNILETRRRCYNSLTAHLPLEIQHPSQYPNFYRGLSYIRFAEVIKSLTGVKLHWENAPLCNEGTWDLKFGQTVWYFVPGRISLCLDTGHLMLGSSSKEEARRRIEDLLLIRGSQINHMHLHANNLVRDEHILDPERIKEVLGEPLLQRLTTGRTFIYEINA